MADRYRFGEVFLRLADAMPVGIRSGDLVHAVRITGVEAASGELPERIEDQLRNAFANMCASLENAGGSPDNIAHVSMFLADPRSAMPAVNAQWVETFPQSADRPTYKFVPAALPAGHLANIEYFAVLGARRQVVNIAGVAHTNPIPMAVRIGDYLFSSRVLPMDASTGTYPAEVAAQLACLFANVGSVIAAGNMAWHDVVQGRLFLADRTNLPAARARWEAMFPDAATRPVLHTLQYEAGPTLQVMLEILAVKS